MDKDLGHIFMNKKKEDLQVPRYELVDLIFSDSYCKVQNDLFGQNAIIFHRKINQDLLPLTILPRKLFHREYFFSSEKSSRSGQKGHFMVVVGAQSLCWDVCLHWWVGEPLGRNPLEK